MQQLIKQEKIENLIHEIRGKQVMLDSDLARLYNSQTKVINQVVKRKINRFPNSFCFKLTIEEYNALRSQIVTLEKSVGLKLQLEK